MNRLNKLENILWFIKNIKVSYFEFTNYIRYTVSMRYHNYIKTIQGINNVK